MSAKIALKLVALAALTFSVAPIQSHAANPESREKISRATAALCRYTYASAESSSSTVTDGTMIFVELGAGLLEKMGYVDFNFDSGIWGSYGNPKSFSLYEPQQKAALITGAVIALNSLKNQGCENRVDGKTKEELLLEKADQWMSLQKLSDSSANSSYYKTVKGFRKYLTLPKIAQDFYAKQDSDLKLMFKIYQQNI